MSWFTLKVGPVKRTSTRKHFTKHSIFITQHSRKLQRCHSRKNRSLGAREACDQMLVRLALLNLSFPHLEDGGNSSYTTHRRRSVPACFALAPFFHLLPGQPPDGKAACVPPHCLPKWRCQFTANSRNPKGRNGYLPLKQCQATIIL